MVLRFLKGLIVGIGGVAPGLSGSVLHIMLAVTGFLFVLDIKVKKPNLQKALHL